MNRIYVKIIALLCLSFTGYRGVSQVISKHSWIPNGPVNAITKSGDIVYVGGTFTEVGKQMPNAALVDASTGMPANTPSPNNYVENVISDGAGGFYIDGLFTKVDGQTRNGLACINANGTLSAFNPQVTASQLPGAKLILAANPTVVLIASYNYDESLNRTRYYLRCFNNHGNLIWTKETDNKVLGATIQNNTVYAAGLFASIEGQSRNRVAALDLSTGSVQNFNPFQGTAIPNFNLAWLNTISSKLYFAYRSVSTGNSKVLSIDLNTGQPDTWSISANSFSKMKVHQGKILLCGVVIKYVDATGIHNKNGLIALDEQSKILIYERANVTKVDTEGNVAYLGVQAPYPLGIEEIISIDLNSGNPLEFRTKILTAGFNPNNQIRCFSANQGKVFIGGDFPGMFQAKRTNLFSYNESTGELTSFNPIVDGEINHLFAGPSKLFVAGSLSEIDGITAESDLAIFDSNTGTLSPTQHTIYSIDDAKSDGRSIYIANQFSGVVSIDLNSAEINPWAPSRSLLRVYKLAVSDQHVLTYEMDVLTRRLAIFDKATGSEIHTPISIFSGGVATMDANNNSLYIAGEFSAEIGPTQAPRSNIAEIDLSTWDVTNWHPELNINNSFEVYWSDLVVRGNTVYVSGVKSVNGIPRVGVAAIDRQSGNPTDWIAQANTSIQGFAPFSALYSTSNAIYVGGAFTSINNQPIQCLAVLSPDRSNVVSGRAFFDINANGIFDGGDTPASQILIKVEPDNIFYPTNSNGEYRIFAGFGSHSIKPIHPTYALAATPEKYDFTFTDDFSVLSNKDFALGVMPSITDMSVNLVNSTAARPGFDVRYALSYKNKGTTPVTGAVRLTLDPNFNFLSSTPAPSSVTGNVYEWALNNLEAGKSESVKLNLKLPPDIALLGRELASTATVTTSSIDSHNDDNTSIVNQTVTGSFDPNDKQVTPLGYGEHGFIPQSTQELIYTIRFQNMGTDTAFNIMVHDILDANLNVSSFTMISASHPYSLVIENGEVRWFFNDIKLPHTAVNEPGSHGYITFSIRPNGGLPEGSVIQNDANIYFDFNPPVLTNTVTNTIKNPPYEPVTVFTDSLVVKRNDEVLMPVKVHGFTNVIGSQFSISWDPSKATFLGLEDFVLPGLDANSFSTGQVTGGNLSLVWLDPGNNPTDLANGTSIFKIRFLANGNYGDTTAVVITGSPVSIEFVDSDYRQIPNIAQNGMIVIDTDLTISGKVLYTNSEPVQNAAVTAAGDNTSTAYTNSLGEYSADLAINSINETIVISASKIDPSPLNGIDVQDVATIRRHILKTELITNPYNIIAADVNKSSTVSVTDIALVQGLILNLITEYPGSNLWTFVPADFAFSNPASPFPFPTTKSMSVAALEGFGPLDFVGIKLGDANSSRDNSQTGRTRSADRIVFDIRQEMIVDEADDKKIVEIPVRVRDFQNISAYQFTVSWDVDKLKFLEVSNKKTSARFGEHKTGSGFLTVIWDEPNASSATLSDKDELFIIKFEAYEGGDYQNLNITDAITEAKVFNKALKQVNHTVIKSELTVDDYLDKIAIYPNPYAESLFVEMYSPEIEDVVLSITDVTGKKVLETTESVLKGKNNLQIGKASELTRGLYIVNIQTNQGTIRTKVVRN